LISVLLLLLVLFILWLQHEADTCPDGSPGELSGGLAVPLRHLSDGQDTESLYAGKIIVVLLVCQ
jgi:hypothetical protein